MANTTTTRIMTSAPGVSINIKGGAYAGITSGALPEYAMGIIPNWLGFPLPGVGHIYDNTTTGVQSWMGILNLGANTIQLLRSVDTPNGRTAGIISSLAAGQTSISGNVNGDGATSLVVSGASQAVTISVVGSTTMTISKDVGTNRITTRLYSQTAAVAGEGHELRLSGLPGYGYVGLKAPETILSANQYTITLPQLIAPSGGMALVTSGAVDELDWLRVDEKLVFNTALYQGASVTVPVGQHNFTNLTSFPTTFHAPASPNQYSRFRVTDAMGQASVNSLTVDFTNGGNRFYGALGATDVITQDRTTRTYIYVDTTIGWVRENG